MRTFTPIISIIIALVAYFFFTSPLLTEIGGVKDQTAQYQEAIKNAKDLNQVLSNLLAKKNAYSTYDQERLSALVPASVDEVKQLVDLKEIARAQNMLIGNILVQKSKTNQGGASGTQTAVQQISTDSFISSDVSFSLIGTYAQFKEVLKDIERSLVLMEIVHLNFSANEGDLQQFDVTIRMFGLPPEKN